MSTAPGRRQTPTPNAASVGKPSEQLPLPLEGWHPGPLFKPGCQLMASIGNLKGKLYRLRLKRATPPWSETEQIQAFYRKAKQLSASTGVKHSVDHVVPLKGEYVCGLHVMANLQILTYEANVQKGNKYVEQDELWPTSTAAIGAEPGTPSGTRSIGTSESESAEIAVTAAFTSILSVSTAYLAGVPGPTSGDPIARAQPTANTTHRARPTEQHEPEKTKARLPGWACD